MKNTFSVPIIVLSLSVMTNTVFAKDEDMNSSSSNMNQTSYQQDQTGYQPQTGNQQQMRNQQQQMGSQQQQNDPIQIIMQDHSKIRQMLSNMNENQGSNAEQGRKKFKELKDFLTKHETMEQKVWYPELEKHKDLKDIISKLKKEEKDASSELNKLSSVKNDQEWVKGFQKLKSDVESHAEDEETNLFPKVKQSVDQQTLNKIATKMMEYRKKNDMQ